MLCLRSNRRCYRSAFLALVVALGAGCALELGDGQKGEDITEVAVTVQQLQETRFSDAFEANNLSNWVRSGTCTTTSSAKYSGSYGARCDDTASITLTVSTQGYSNITVAYVRRTNAYDSGEYFYSEWSADGTTWNLIERISNNTSWTQKAFVLPAAANNVAGLKIRFRSNANGIYERFDLDEVVVTGDDGCVPSCSGKACGNNGCGGSCGSCPANYMCSEGACEYGPAPPSFFEDGFESNLSNWTISNFGFGGCSIASSAKNSGSYGVRCSDSPALTTTRSTVGYKDIKVEYWRRTYGYDSDYFGGYEYLFVEWSPNGSTWYGLEQTQDTTYRFMNHTLPASAENLSALRLRFRSNASLTSETFDLDDVVIRGTPATCTPNCAGASCGADGCGGSCGTCGDGTSCSNGSCMCVPNCNGDACGCGSCGAEAACVDGQCQSSCTPDCTDKECGDDGCGGTCGSCNVNEACSAGMCECMPSCSGKTCGPDGCGGTCGTCASGQSCSAAGSCQSSVANPGATGPHSVCSYTTNLSDSGYASAIVSYPCNTTGLLGATTLTGGYTNKKEDMYWLKDRVASHGYIVIAMTPNNTWGDTTEWYTAHTAGHAKLLSENNRSGSPIFGRVDASRTQIMGFSKGGGGALRAANNLGSKVKTLQALAPWLESSRVNTVWSAMTASTACYTSSNDSIAPPGNVRTFFSNLPTGIARVFSRFTGATHGHWYGSDSSSNLTYRNRFATHIIAWMKIYLDGNIAYKTYIDDVNGSAHDSQESAGWYDQPNASGSADGYTYFQ
jgi:hypothetical protein